MSSTDLLVVKLGGGAGLDLAAACDDLANVSRQRPLVVVHGVSDAMNQLCAQLGIEVQTLTSPSGHSSRYTPPAIRDVYVRAAEHTNTELVTQLRRRDVSAIGFVSDSVVVRGSRKQAIRAVMNGRIRMVRDDHSGAIKSIETAALREALAQSQVPVLPPMAISEDGLLNVDGDRAGAAVAGGLGASALVILSNVRGLYRDFPAEDSFVEQVALPQIDSALDWAQGRMKRKVLAAQEALAQDVATVIIGDGRVSDPVSNALRGEGTRFTA